MNLAMEYNRYFSRMGAFLCNYAFKLLTAIWNCSMQLANIGPFGSASIKFALLENAAAKVVGNVP